MKEQRAQQQLYVFLLRADQLGALGILASGTEGAAPQAFERFRISSLPTLVLILSQARVRPPI